LIAGALGRLVLRVTKLRVYSALIYSAITTCLTRMSTISSAMIKDAALGVSAIPAPSKLVVAVKGRRSHLALKLPSKRHVFERDLERQAIHRSPLLQAYLSTEMMDQLAWELQEAMFFG
jgi:hypothetical protein